MLLYLRIFGEFANDFFNFKIQYEHSLFLFFVIKSFLLIRVSFKMYNFFFVIFGKVGVISCYEYETVEFLRDINPDYITSSELLKRKEND